MGIEHFRTILDHLALRNCPASHKRVEMISMYPEGAAEQHASSDNHCYGAEHTDDHKFADRSQGAKRYFDRRLIRQSIRQLS